jgi:hypothetical protein
MTEAEFREKFTERFKLEPNEVIPAYVLEQAETIPTDAVNLTKEELHWAQKVALSVIRRNHSMSGRMCGSHSSSESCEKCLNGMVLPFKS